MANNLKYYVLDVFTSEKYKGNPLSVVIPDRELEFSDYRKIANEFGYSETSFIEVDKAGILRVRSFTPAGIEVNGAGHNLLGAICLALEKKIIAYRKEQEKRYVIMADEEIHYSLGYNTENEVAVSMLQKPALIKKIIPIEDIAQAINLNVEDLILKGLAPSVVSTEATHLLVPIKNAARLNEAESNKKLLTQLGQEYGFEGCYLFTLNEQSSEFVGHSRFFNPGIGIEEDPATGSAAGPLAGFLFQKNIIQKEVNYSILQGEKMGRPSTIHFKISEEGIWVGGSASVVMEGSLFID